MNKTLILSGTILSSLFISAPVLASTYEVQKGDSLFKIAQKNNTSVQELKTLNHLNSNIILPRQVLKIDDKEKTYIEKTYIVKAGDSLNKIAHKFGTTTNQLIKLNKEISNPNIIVVGQAIRLSGSSDSSSSSVEQSDTYIVKSGDSLYKISKTYNTTVEFLLTLNPEINNANNIRAGQKIKVKGTAVDTTNDSRVSLSTPDNESSTYDPASKPASRPTSTATATTHSVSADSVLAAGAKYLGAKYVYGASTLRTDIFDCSSFTWRVFKEGADIFLPRSSRAQAEVGTPVSFDSLRKGDLVFFDTNGDGTINHVGIYAGNGQMLNASTSAGVSYASLDNSYWQPRMVKAVRVLN